MLNEISFEIFLFAVCALFGVFAALVFDSFRVSRRLVRTGTVLTGIEDILFWIITALCFFALCLRFNNGEIRVFMLFGVMAGALVYFNTVSSFMVKGLVKLLKLIWRILSFILKVVLWPLRLVVRILNRPVFCVLNLSKRGAKNLYKKMKFRFAVFRKFSFFSRFTRG